jgi:hypothetical protein
MVWGGGGGGGGGTKIMSECQVQMHRIILTLR